MTPERWERARELFDAARALPVERRGAFLNEADADAELLAEVNSLLHAHDAVERGVGKSYLEALDPARTSALLQSRDDPADTADPDGLPGGAIIGRYRIVRRLGHGGMGVVYLAHDPRLDRPVAIKLLPRRLSLDASARRRFEEEARAASALDHPHIGTIYEIGEAADGRIFIAMAYYEGETLREQLERGPLPIPQALALATRLGEALAAAHARGIVHRDVKPANVLIMPDGGVRIVDFGIAKIAGSSATRTGAALGTVAYMSPEQTRGEVAEPATDVWSLGVTFYEVLAGRRPFRAENEQALVYAIRNDEPDPIRHLRAEVPRRIAGVVGRCLTKHPSDRYPDAGALLADLQASIAGGGMPLRWRATVHSGIAVGLALLLLGGTYVLWPRTQAAPTLLAAPAERATSRVAVLPLANYSPDPEDVYFADGMTEELISRLSRLPGLRVIARTSVMTYGQEETSIPAIGRELNVGFVLQGSVRKADRQVRIAMQLIETGTGENLWTEEYQTDLTDVLEVQREIAERVADNLDLRIPTRDHARLAGRGTESTDAYAAYLKGRYFLSKLDEASFRQSRDHFQQALDLDPAFPQAWSGLSDAYQQLASVSALHSGEAYPRARAAAERALELDPDLADAHASLALALSMYYWDSEAAERHFQRAVDLDPSYARARRMYASHLRNLGRFDQAIAEVREARVLDPLAAFPRLEEAIILYVGRRYDEAIAHCLRFLDTAPGSSRAYTILALAYAQAERYDEALGAVAQADTLGREPDAHAIRGYIYARTGRRAEALRILDRLNQLAGEQAVSPFHNAAIHIALGEHGRAMDVLERAADERTGHVRLLRVDPVFDPLRSEPRFQALLERVRLAG